MIKTTTCEGRRDDAARWHVIEELVYDTQRAMICGPVAEMAL